MDSMQIGVLSVVLLIGLCALRIPIGYTLGLIGAVGLTSMLGFESAFNYVAMRLHTVIASFTFTAIPLFFLMGYFAIHAGLTTDAFQAARVWLARLPGGVASAVVMGCAVFGACSGAGLPAAAALGRIAVPEMIALGYSPGLATGVVAAASPLAVLIPPSVLMIIYGGITNTSVARLLIGGIGPGILATVMFIGGITLAVKMRPSLAPSSAGLSFSWRERMGALKSVWGVLLLFLAVVGSIYMGLATPTEAAAVGALGAMLLAVSMRRLDVPKLKDAAYETARISAQVFLIIAMAQIFSAFITQTGAVDEVVAWVLEMQMTPAAFMVIISIVYIILGMFLDSTSMIVLTMPAVFPVIQALGLDPVWFGVMVIVYVEIAAITPPLGITVYLVKGAIGDLVDLWDIFKGAFMFFIMWIAMLFILYAIPNIILWLPNQMKGAAW